MAKTKLKKKTKKTSAVKVKTKATTKTKVKAKVKAKTKAVKPKASAAKKTTKVAASKKAVVTKVAKAKVKVKASAPKVALKKESDKKKPSLAKTGATTTEPMLDPGLLTKQQVRSLERLIQKNAEWVQISSVLQQNARPYKMQDSFQERMAIKHPVLGLGYVTLAENHKMTVLFEDGPRNLIMNYKS